MWNIATGEAICGSPAQVMSAGCTHAVAYSNTSDDVFVTGGKYDVSLLLHNHFECVYSMSKHSLSIILLIWYIQAML